MLMSLQDLISVAIKAMFQNSVGLNTDISITYLSNLWFDAG